MAVPFNAEAFGSVDSNSLQPSRIADGLGRPLLATASPSSNELSASNAIALAGLSSTRDAVTAAAALHALNPLQAVLQSADQISTVLVERLITASDKFFDLYLNAYRQESDSSQVLAAHAEVLASLDHLLAVLNQSGLGGLPCSATISPSSPKAEEGQPKQATQAIDSASLGVMATSTFERRERLRESASMISNILLHDI